MTVSATSPIQRYDYPAIGRYDFHYRIFEESDLSVTVKGADGSIETLTLTTDYTVTINSGSDGGYIDTTYIGSYGVIEIRRTLPLTQETDWVNNDPFDMETLENDQDKMVMILQQINVNTSEGLQYTNWRGTWVTAAVYLAGDMVKSSDNKYYACVTNHTSGVLADDIISEYWVLMFDAQAVNDDMVAAEAAAVAAEAAAVAAAASESSAGTSETNASASELAAGTSEANAGVSETNAGTSETNAGISETNAAATAASLNLPALQSGDVTKHLEVNSTEDGYDLVPKPGLGVLPLGLKMRLGAIGGGYESDIDADHDILWASTLWHDSAREKLISFITPFTKKIDAVWAAGDNAGGLLNGTAVPVGANKWYLLFDLLKDSDDSVEGCFLTWGDALTTYLPTGYSKYRFRGMVYTDASSNICPFIFTGEELWFLQASKSIFSTGLTQQAYTSLSLDTLIPTHKISHLVPAAQSNDASNPLAFYVSIDGVNTHRMFMAVNTAQDNDDQYAWSTKYPPQMLGVKDTLYYKVDSSIHSFLIHALRLIR